MKFSEFFFGANQTLPLPNNYQIFQKKNLTFHTLMALDIELFLR